MKVICVGFSVTEMTNSYVPAADLICKRHGLFYDIHRCGIGGIGVDTLAYIFHEILDAHTEVNHFVLEIATGSGRSTYWGQKKDKNDLSLFKYIERIIVDARSRGKFIGFINFPRDDVGYAEDPLELAILIASNLYDVPVKLFNYETLSTNSDFKDFLYDGVHVHEEGATKYAEGLIELLEKGLKRPASYRGKPDNFTSYLIKDLLSAEAVSFERHGYHVDMCDVAEGTSVSISAPQEKNICGFTYISGPSSGLISIKTDAENDAKIISLFDEYSYYSRINTYFFSVPCNNFELQVCGRNTDIVLVKGTVDNGPRIARLGHLLLK